MIPPGDKEWYLTVVFYYKYIVVELFLHKLVKSLNKISGCKVRVFFDKL